MNVVCGVWSGHDASYCIKIDGEVIRHDELERFVREKECPGDSIGYLSHTLDGLGIKNIDCLATVAPSVKTFCGKSFEDIVKHKSVRTTVTIGHHKAHAANAFFSSTFSDALIITLDGGGVESDSVVTAHTTWFGAGNKLSPLEITPIQRFNIGGVWTRATRYVFGLQSGWPKGHQAGTVMAMAALGDPMKYVDDFYKMLTVDNAVASMKPRDQPAGARIEGKDPTHPYLDKWARLRQKSEQEQFDLAAGLQAATEKLFSERFEFILKNLAANLKFDNVCFAGGVALNSVMIGKIYERYCDRYNFYVTPTPHDGGLSIGAAQCVYYDINENSRDLKKTYLLPYLGKTYTKEEIYDALETHNDSSKSLNAYNNMVLYKNMSDNHVMSELAEGKIIAVFGGGSESGKRALGNRSILADPRDHKMKATINERVKHRQWFRPFAPSILHERVKDWFKIDSSTEFCSPYMSFVAEFTDSAKRLVPAVAHFDGTARLQTVKQTDNEWYHGFLTKWEKFTGVPILLNTSANDTEPIVETPAHAINLLLKTDIDGLFFRDISLYVTKVD